MHPFPIRPRAAAGALVLLLVGGLAAWAQAVRTADVTVRGFLESDFPRLVPLAEGVYAYEDLNGDTNGNLAFTTNSLIVVTADGVLVADGQNSVEKTRRLVDTVAGLTEQPIRWVVVGADHGDHINGNSAFPADAEVIAHPTSAARLAAAGRGIRAATATVTDELVLTPGGVEVRVLFLGRAHTGGDLMVHVPGADVLFLSEAYFNRLYPSVGGSRSAYPIEWIQTLRRAEAIGAAVTVPGHAIVDRPEIHADELVNYRRALENLVAESRRLHADGVPLENAPRLVNLGEFQYWYRAANNMPDAVRQVYLEIDGQLD
jgi:glyoxylase-like metal-dependent hydrolase (beta-lactamase superfamily II)